MVVSAAEAAASGWGQALLTLGTVALTALVAPLVMRRVASKEAVRATERAQSESDRRRAQISEGDQIKQLWAAHNRDIEDLRQRLTKSEQLRAKQGERIGLLEQEVAEWRAGVRGVYGVWVAVPSHIWQWAREQYPELPSGPFPGERPGDTAGPPQHPND